MASLMAALQEKLGSELPDDLSAGALDTLKKAMEEALQQEDLPAGVRAVLGDPLALNDALRALKRYSLVERAGDSLSVHRLVQAVVRDRLSADDQKTWAAAAATLVNAAFPGDIQTNMKSWPVCARLLPHALAAARQAAEEEVALEAAGRLLNHTGHYLRVRADFVASKSCYKSALFFMEKAFGPDHAHTASSVNNLGSLLQEMGDLNGALKYLERGVRIGEAAYGPDHPEVATDVNNLGSILLAQGDLSGARACAARSLDIWRRFLGEDHPTTQLAQENLAVVEEMLKEWGG